MTRPPEIVHWSEIEEPAEAYPGDDETMGCEAGFGRHFNFARLGINHVRLPPGHRSSFPHAESVEDEFVLVLDGTPDVWLDGTLYRLAPGDGVGFPAGTGLCHSSSTTQRRTSGCWSLATSRCPRTGFTIR